MTPGTDTVLPGGPGEIETKPAQKSIVLYGVVSVLNSNFPPATTASMTCWYRLDGVNGARFIGGASALHNQVTLVDRMAVGAEPQPHKIHIVCRTGNAGLIVDHADSTVIATG